MFSGKYITPKAMQRLDLLAQEKYGIPSLILMENAGRSAADVVWKMLGKKKKSVVVVCGSGNNGGDGLVCARHLINRGAEAGIFMIGGEKELKTDVRINSDILKKSGYNVRRIRGNRGLSALAGALKRCTIVVDAIFGIGFHGEVREPHASIIERINRAKKPVAALDVPSGLDALSGRASQPCIKARSTITFGFPKTGLIRNDGPRYAGRVIIADISFPRRLRPVSNS